MIVTEPSFRICGKDVFVLCGAVFRGVVSGQVPKSLGVRRVQSLFASLKLVGHLFGASYICCWYKFFGFGVIVVIFVFGL